MMSPLDVFSEPVWQRLTWTLLHFLWQGLAVAVLLAAVLRWFPVRRARTRYATCLAAMLAMAACPLVTFAWLSAGARGGAEDTPQRRSIVAFREVGLRPSLPVAGEPREGVDEVAIASEPVEPRRDTIRGEQAAADRPIAAVDQPAAAGDVGLQRTLHPLRRFVGVVQPYLLAGWIVGVAMLGVRLLLGQVGVQWVRRGRRPIPAEVISCVARLGERLGLRAFPRVFVSEKVREAVVVGLLRPMVLLPACWLTEMTPEVLEAVIAHELAHVRRWDLWVNLLQRLMETLLFYQPAVWWVSRRIRLEREMCCDELAVAATGERMAYATALSQAAHRGAVRNKPLLGATMGGTEMTLLSRVHNVLGLSPGRERARWWPVGLLALLVPLVIWFSSTGAGAPGEGGEHAEEALPGGPQEGPEKRELSEDLKRSARLAVTLELMTLHFRTWETDELRRRLSERLTQDLRQHSLEDREWRVRLLPWEAASLKRAQLDPFEEEALAQVREGKDDMWQQTANGGTRYVRVIRATEKSCLVCHQALRNDLLKANDILGVASLTLAGGEENAIATRNAISAAGGRPGTRADDAPASEIGKDAVANKPVLRLTIGCGAAMLKEWDPIPIVFTVANDGRGDYKYIDRDSSAGGRMGEYMLEAFDEQGNAVPNPRGKETWDMGGLGRRAVLGPGESLAKTIALNRWAMVTKAGTYKVIGTCDPQRAMGEPKDLPAVRSEPITITVQPRSNAEKAEYIEELSTRLATNLGQNGADELVRKLMYTCDRRIVPSLIKAMYHAGTADWWAREAFKYYLAGDANVTDALLAVAAKRGMAEEMFDVLRRRGCTAEQLKPVIEVSLSLEHPQTWHEGARAAMAWGDDRFTPRLMAIATDASLPPRNSPREQAIRALPCHRTDEAVAVLKRLLEDPNPAVRDVTADAVRMAYLCRDEYKDAMRGHPLRDDDFDAKYRKRPGGAD